MLEIVGIVLFVVLPVVAALWVSTAWYLEHRRDRIPILLYHRLIRKEDADAGRVPDNERIWVTYDTSFAEQMRFLRDAGYTTLDFDDYVSIRSGERHLPERPVLVTFDDGYESNHGLAFPALREHGQKATIFVALEPDEHTRRQVEGIDGFLSEEQMRELSSSDVSIQSHSLTHPILTELSNEEVRFELEESKRRLELVTGRPVRHLAIPRAGYDRKIRRQAQEAGYTTVCCNNKGTSTGLSDRFALPRIVIDRDMGLRDFARALSPRVGFELRLLGNVKRIPERIGGARFARNVRDLLYEGPLRPLFTTRNLKRGIAAAAAGYIGGGVWFAWRLLA